MKIISFYNKYKNINQEIQNQNKISKVDFMGKMLICLFITAQILLVGQKINYIIGKAVSQNNF